MVAINTPYYYSSLLFSTDGHLGTALSPCLGPTMACYSSFPGPREGHRLVTRTEFATYSELATSVPSVLFRVLTGAEEALLHPF